MSSARIDKNNSIESSNSVNKLKDQAKIQRMTSLNFLNHSISPSKQYINHEDFDHPKHQENVLITKTLGDYNVFVKNVLNRQQSGYFPLLGIERSFNKDAIDFLSQNKQSSSFKDEKSLASSTKIVENTKTIDDFKIDHFIHVMTSCLRHKKIAPLKYKRVKLSPNKNSDLDGTLIEGANGSKINLSETDEELQEYMHNKIKDDTSFKNIVNNSERKLDNSAISTTSSIGGGGELQQSQALVSNFNHKKSESPAFNHFKPIELFDNNNQSNNNTIFSDQTFCPINNSSHAEHILIDKTLGHLSSSSNNFNSNKSDSTLKTIDSDTNYSRTNDRADDNDARNSVDIRSFDGTSSVNSNGYSVSSEVSTSNNSDVHTLIFIGSNDSKRKLNQLQTEKYFGKEKLFHNQLSQSLKKLNNITNVEPKCIQTLECVLISLKLILSHETINDDTNKIISDSIGLLNSIVNSARKKVTPLFFAVCLFTQSVLYDKLYINKMDQMKKDSKTIVDFMRENKRHDVDDIKIPIKLFSTMQSYVTQSRYSLHARQCYSEAISVFDNYKDFLNTLTLRLNVDVLSFQSGLEDLVEFMSISITELNILLKKI